MHTLDVHGPLACFSRPEMKAERFSYPVITPSAARGIFDAIYLKPRAFRWQVRRIEILAPPRYLALRRNEVKEKVNLLAVKRWLADPGAPVEPIWADADKALSGSDEKGRTQRQTMALADVKYRLHAEVMPWPGHEEDRESADSQFRRRARHGKCFQQPYFGCREFPAYFDWVDPGQEDAPAKDRIDLDLDVGLMLYDVFDLASPGGPESRPRVSLFHARVVNGVLEVPPFDDPAVLKLDSSEAL